MTLADSRGIVTLVLAETNFEIGNKGIWIDKRTGKEYRASDGYAAAHKRWVVEGGHARWYESEYGQRPEKAKRIA